MSERRVYVVDDEEPIQRSLQMMLRVLGYAPEAFGSGSQFIASLPHLKPGCMLLDLRMPEIDGLEVQRRLSATDGQMSVIMMSGHGDLAVAVTAMEQGAVAFLEKPFARSALEQALALGFQRLEDEEGYLGYLQSAASALRQLRIEEGQVVDLIARGHETDSIIRLTGLSIVDLELARSRIFAALGTDTLTDVLRIAFAARAAPAP